MSIVACFARNSRRALLGAVVTLAVALPALGQSNASERWAATWATALVVRPPPAPPAAPATPGAPAAPAAPQAAAAAPPGTAATLVAPAAPPAAPPPGAPGAVPATPRPAP